MNIIAETARRALTAPGYPTQNHLCQMWARRVVEEALGGKPMGTPNPASAVVAAHRLLAGKFGFAATDAAQHGGLQPGDLLYKTQGSGGDGHVGIYLGDGKVAENSTVHWNATGGRDARGIRTLEQFGAFQVVARFLTPATVGAKLPPVSTPEPVLVPRLFLNDIQVKGAQKVNGLWFGPLRAIADAGKMTLQQQSSDGKGGENWRFYK